MFYRPLIRARYPWALGGFGEFGSRVAIAAADRPLKEVTTILDYHAGSHRLSELFNREFSYWFEPDHEHEDLPGPTMRAVRVGPVIFLPRHHPGPTGGSPTRRCRRSLHILWLHCCALLEVGGRAA